MTLADNATLAADATWRLRISAAATQNAVTIGLAVLETESPTAVDKARLILARAILAEEGLGASLFAMAVANTPGISGAADDADLVFWVGSTWNLVADVPI